MFFYISGIASIFFNTKKKGFLVYFYNKFMRLMLPFGLAIPIFLVPRLFFGQEYEDFAYIKGKKEWNFLSYFVNIFKEGILMKLSWLWFLPVLFIDSIFCYPLLVWTVRRSKKI
jgi:hypothetical protein